MMFSDDYTDHEDHDRETDIIEALGDERDVRCKLLLVFLHPSLAKELPAIRFLPVFLYLWCFLFFLVMTTIITTMTIIMTHSLLIEKRILWSK